MQLDFDKARANMVESQVRTNDVSNIDLISAISNTRREMFVDEAATNFAYSEINVKSASGRLLLKPRDFSKLAHSLNVSAKDDVLVIAGSGGYSAAVLALLAKSVTIFDENECKLDVCENVKGNLANLSELNSRQFDVVFVDQGVETIPNAWLDSIKDGGRMGIIQSKNSVGKASIYLKNDGVMSSRDLFETQAPILPQFNRIEEFEF